MHQKFRSRSVLSPFASWHVVDRSLIVCHSRIAILDLPPGRWEACPETWFRLTYQRSAQRERRCYDGDAKSSFGCTRRDKRSIPKPLDDQPRRDRELQSVDRHDMHPIIQPKEAGFPLRIGRLLDLPCLILSHL